MVDRAWQIITQPHSDVFAGDSGGDALFRSGAAEGYMKKCPDEDTCCFSLREYMAIDFWGRKSAYIMFETYRYVQRGVKTEMRNFFTKAGFEVTAHFNIPKEHFAGLLYRNVNGNCPQI